MKILGIETSWNGRMICDGRKGLITPILYQIARMQIMVVWFLN